MSFLTHCFTKTSYVVCPYNLYSIYTMVLTINQCAFSITGLFFVEREHINSIDQHIQFSAADQRSDGAMPFLDILITPGRDGSLSTSVYRKPTHTDLYLQWDSHHTLTSKYSMIGTLQHRAQTICSNPQLLQKEEQHLKNALKNCKYPTWALNRIQMKTKKQDSKQVPTNRTNMNNQKKSYIVVPYYSGLSDSIKNIGRMFGVQVYFKGGTTIKNLLMTPKDKDPIQEAKWSHLQIPM